MSYQSMDCLQCVRKHLANAISYAKEVLAGHGEGGDPDHRPDLLGELGNAEHHLSVNEQYIDFRNIVLDIRRQYEQQEYVVTAEMIRDIRVLWIDIYIAERLQPVPELIAVSDRFKEARPEGIEKTLVKDPIDILILEGNTEEEKEYIHDMIKTLPGVGKVYENKLPEKDEPEHILIWPPRTGIIRSIHAGLDQPMYVSKDGVKKWDCKPQVVITEIWRKNENLTECMELNEAAIKASNNVWVDLATKKISNVCCKDKAALDKGAMYIKWSKSNWPAVKTYLDKIYK